MMMVAAVGIASEIITKQSPADVVTTRNGRRTGRIDCLVVTGDASRRNRFEGAIELAGWLECAAPESAAELRTAVDCEYQLVIVDVASPLGDRVNDTIEAAEEFAARPGTLLVVCGSEDNIDEELWARQLGAWLYLPGVCDGDSLTSLCVEARRLRAGVTAFAATR
jgi:DNA-binding NtrC family response regulator